MSGDDHLAPFIQRVPELAKVTPEALAAALHGFPLSCPYGMPWLARAIQGVLLHTMPPEPAGCEQVSGLESYPPSKTEVRKAAKDLKAKVEVLLGSISRHRLCVERMGVEPVESPLWEALEVLSDFAEAKGESPRWRQKVARDVRTQRAEFLAVVFDLAFERAATVNNWPESDGGPWPDFYQRVMELVFGEKATPDRQDILKAARRKALQQIEVFGSDIRGIFSPGTIPEYPA